MKRKHIMIVTVLFLVMGIAGCGTDKKVYYEQTDEATEIASRENDATEVSLQADDEAVMSLQADHVTEVSLQADQMTDSSQNQEEAYYVYVCGAVQVPGVYMLHAGDRIYEAITMAGGLREDASTISVNQAEMVSDGQMIFVPTVEEANAGITMPQVSVVQDSAKENGDAAGDGKVDLNTASLEELMTLPGIGETRANDILTYRMEHGAFAAVEEIMNVNGIKEGLYNRIKDNIKVN